MELVVQQQRQPAILLQHVKNHLTTMTDATEPTMEDIAVVKVHVVLIQHWLLVLSTAVELES